jgi:CDP-glycerol glycerophosphotransferase (TagB/SpsB family)
MKKFRKLKRIILFGILLLFFVIIDFAYLLTYLFPKQKNKWLFGSSIGKEYSDNAKFLFEYINKNSSQTNHQIIWITKKRSIVKSVRQLGYSCFYFLSLKGIWHTLSAKRIFVTHCKGDINNILINNQVDVVNLWHGIPLKKINADLTSSLRNNWLYEFFINYMLFPFKDNTSLVPTSGKIVQKRIMSGFRLSQKQTPILGSPREDILINAKPKSVKKSLSRILYAPTHRGSQRTLTLLPNNTEYNKLNEFLKQNKIILDFRLHRFDKIHLKKLNLLDKYSQIRIDPYDNIEDSMINSDILITDYSSCFYDYLLLDKPLIFHAPDLKRYMSLDDQFYEKNYDQFIPGPKTQNWDEVISNLQNFINKKDEYKTKRKDLKNKIFEFTDGKNCERILKFLQNRHH